VGQQQQQQQQQQAEETEKNEDDGLASSLLCSFPPSFCFLSSFLASLVSLCIEEQD